MNKKFGKFKLWQLVAIGALIGGAVYLYKRQRVGTNPEEAVGGTGTGAFGPIDPNSGIPFAFEGGLGGAGSGAGSQTLGELLGQIGQIRELFPEPSPTVTTVENETRTKGAQANARKARVEARKAHRAEVAAKRAQHKAEHQTTQRPHKTGAAASVPQTHHSPTPPAARYVVPTSGAFGTPKTIGKKKAKRKRR